MRRGAAYLALALAVLLAPAAAADAPDRSPRPDPRPAPAAAVTEPLAPVAEPPAAPATAQAPAASLRPAPRPGATAPPPPEAAPPNAIAAAGPPPVLERRGLFGGLFRPNGQPRAGATVAAAGALAVLRSPRPALRPAGLEQRVRAAATRQTPGRVAQQGERGALCGVPGLVGERLEPITGRTAGCGIAEPVRLRAVDGIPLTTPATINCQTARALQAWVQQSVVPAVGREGGGVASLRVAASYACRTRNNQPGARVSEHGRGNAIDIAGIGLANGTELTVLTGWRDNRQGPILRELHRGACGPFGTVLGPNADRFHQDHFHFDTASYRTGPYCR